MKKHYLSSMITAAVLVASSSAIAAPSEFLIKGRLIPPACTPQVSGGGIIDYGDIPASKLSETAATTLEDRKASLTVSCEESVRLGIRIADDRASTKPLLGTEIPAPVKHASGLSVASNDLQTFGLGLDSLGNKLGVWWLTMNVTELAVDSTKGKSLLYTINNGTNWGITQAAPLDPFSNAGKTTFAIGTSATSGGAQPAAGLVHHFPFTVGAAINKRSSISLTDNTNLDGKASFHIYYY